MAGQENIWLLLQEVGLGHLTVEAAGGVVEVLVGKKVDRDATSRVVDFGNLGACNDNKPREEEKSEKERSRNVTFMLHSVAWRTLSRSHWTASGVQDPTLTARSARQHFRA